MFISVSTYLPFYVSICLSLIEYIYLFCVVLANQLTQGFRRSDADTVANSLTDRQTDICVAYYIDCHILLNPSSHGRRPSGDWGDGPLKLRWGDGSCIRPPNIFEK